MATTTKRAILWNTTAGAKVTAAFTPAANDLLIAVTGHSFALGTDPADTITDSQSGTWDLVGTYRSHSTAVGGGLRIWARTAAVTASSMTVTSTPGGTSTGGGLAVLSVSGTAGYGSGAIRAQAGQADVAAGTPAPVLPGAALTTSTLIGAVMTNTNGSANCAPPAGWAVEDYDLGYTTPATGIEVCHRDTGETNTTITFGAATPSQFGALVIEILPAASTADLTVTLYQGATAKASKVITGITVSAFTDDSFTLTGGEADSITDYNDLRLGFKASGTGGGRVDVSWTEMEMPGSPPNVNIAGVTVLGAATIPAPTVRGTAVATPATVAAVATVPTPTVVGGNNATATPAKVSGVASVGVPTTSGTAIWSGDSYFDEYGVGGTVTVLSAIPTPTIIATSGGTTATPATVAAAASIPAPTILTPDVVVPAVRVLAITAVATPTISATAIGTSSTVAGVVAVLTPTVQGTAKATPNVVAGTTTVPAPTVIPDTRPAPATVAATATVPASTVRGTAVVTPATVAAFAAIPTPAVVVGGNATVIAATVAGIATVGAPTTQAVGRPTPSTVAGVVSVPTVVVMGKSVTVPATVAVLVSIPTPTVFLVPPGTPVRDPQANLTSVEGIAALLGAEGKSILTEQEGRAVLVP
jgi:hypothetical protein